MEINILTNMHLLELSSTIHVVRKQIKYILVNERPRDISLARLRDLICRVYKSVNGRTRNNIIRLFRIKVRFSNALFVSEKKRKTNNTLS